MSITPKYESEDNSTVDPNISVTDPNVTPSVPSVMDYNPNYKLTIPATNSFTEFNFFGLFTSVLSGYLSGGALGALESLATATAKPPTTPPYNPGVLPVTGNTTSAQAMAQPTTQKPLTVLR